MSFGREATRNAGVLAIKFVLMGMLLVGSGCTGMRDYVRNGFKVGPNYARPDAAVADEWIDQDDERLASIPVQYHRWWTVFQDPALDLLIDRASRENLSLRTAGARVLQARAHRAVAVGSLFPQRQEGVAELAHLQQSQEVIRFGPTSLSTWQLGGNLAWELDFWGRYRRAVESADARLEASIADCNDVYVLLLAEVAGTYVELRTLEKRLEYVWQNTERLKESKRIADVRFKFQVQDSEIDQTQAASNLDRILASIPDLQKLHRQAHNRLAFLMGMPPEDLTELIAYTGRIPEAPRSVAVGMPRDLLRRRPDVCRAERQLAAQCAEIGIAEADLLPHLAIRGSLGLSANEFSDLLTLDAFGGTVGPSLRWDVFNYGRLTNRVKFQEARFQELVLRYYEVVLNANREAEDAAVAFLCSHDKIVSLNSSVEHAAKGEKTATVQYRAGSIDFNRLAALQEVLVTRQDDLATAQGEQTQSFIALVKALGGGWEPAPAPPAPEAPETPPSVTVPATSAETPHVAARGL